VLGVRLPHKRAASAGGSRVYRRCGGNGNSIAGEEMRQGDKVGFCHGMDRIRSICCLRLERHLHEQGGKGAQETSNHDGNCSTCELDGNEDSLQPIKWPLTTRFHTFETDEAARTSKRTTPGYHSLRGCKAAQCHYRFPAHGIASRRAGTWFAKNNYSYHSTPRPRQVHATIGRV
jgi:hypothetical protein